MSLTDHVDYSKVTDVELLRARIEELEHIKDHANNIIQQHKRCIKAWRNRKIEVGLCRNCGKRPARPGKLECSICAGKRNELERKLREKRKAMQVCVKCEGRLAEGSTTLCDFHAEKNRAKLMGYSKHQVEAWIDANNRAKAATGS